MEKHSKRTDWAIIIALIGLAIDIASFVIALASLAIDVAALIVDIVGIVL